MLKPIDKNAYYSKYIISVIVLVIFFATLSLLGYFLNIPILTSISSHYPSMKFSSAIGFLLFSISFLIKLNTRKTTWINFSNLGFLLTFIIGLLSLYQNIYEVYLNIDYTIIHFFNQNSFTQPNSKSLMSPVASCCFMLISSLGLIKNDKKNLFNTIAQYCLHLTTLTSFLAIEGYIFYIPTAFKISLYSSMSVQTAFSFFFLSIAAAFIQPNIGFIGLFTGDNIGNSMARKLFFRILVIVQILTYIRIITDRLKLVSVEFGIILFSSTYVITTLFLIKIVAHELNKINLRKKDAESGFKKFKNLLDLTPDPIIIIDAKGFIILANNQVELVFGHGKDSLINQNIELLIPFENLKNQNFYLNLKDNKQKKVISNMELLGIDKSGKEFILEINLNPTKDTSGDFYIVAIRDITWRKLAEEELKQSNERNKIFVQQSPNAIAMFDNKMNYMAASHKWITDYNLNDIEIIGKSHYEIFPEIGEDWKFIHTACLKGEINTCEEARFERADGSIQWITWDVRPWYISDGNIGGLIMYTADITNIKEKDIEKRKIEEILDRTNEVARIGTWEVNFDTENVYWSRITKEIHHVPLEFEPSISTAINFYKEGESRNTITEAIQNSIQKNEVFDLEAEIVTYNGTTKWIRAIGQPEFINNECKRVYGVFQDIDKVKKIEQEVTSLLKSTTEQNERLKNFAHIVSHNLRSHSTNIEMMLEIYLTENPEVKNNELLVLLKKGTNNLKETIQHLTEVVLMNTSIEKNLVPINLNDTLNHAISNVNQMIKDAEVTIINEIDPKIYVIGLMAYLDSIVLNFMTNGIKYRSMERKAEIKFSTKISGNFVVLEIADNGIGIDLQMNGAKLFGMYKTFNGNKDARGIGLYITKNQIETIGGSVEVSSELNKGTIFKIFLKNGEKS